MTAAPLKRQSVSAQTFDDGLAIRGHMTAAPLKLSIAKLTGPRCHPYPRSHDRGPIEASPSCAGWKMERSYPRSHDRGPVEASKTGRPRLPEFQDYPRSHDRGPIEASCVLNFGTAFTGYPRSHDRGPIEAGWSRAVALDRPRLSAVT